MIVHDVTQGTPEWLKLRSGIPTASSFDQIVYSKLDENGVLPKSKSQGKYLHILVAERLMGEPEEKYQSNWMERGISLELEAVGSYEFRRDVDTTPVGFVTTDDGRIGCSPDRFAGDDGGVEIKCPKGSTHLGYLMSEDGAAGDYIQQVQGTLWITGRKWWDVFSYHPRLPPSLVRIHRDERYIAQLAKRVREFSDRLEALVAECREKGWGVTSTTETSVDAAHSIIEQRLRGSLFEQTGEEAPL